MFLDNLKKVNGSLFIANNNKETDNFKNIISNLEYVGGSLSIISNNGISSFGDDSFLNNITQIDGKISNELLRIAKNLAKKEGEEVVDDLEFLSLQFDNNPKISKLELNNLKIVTTNNNQKNTLVIDGNNNLTEINFPSLTTSLINLEIINNELLTDIKLDELTKIDSINISNNKTLEKLNNFKKLVEITSFLLIEENNKLNNIQFPKLTKLDRNSKNRINNNAPSINDDSATWTNNAQSDGTDNYTPIEIPFTTTT